MTISRKSAFFSALLGFACCVCLWAVCYRTLMPYECAPPPALIKKITFGLMTLALVLRVAEHVTNKRRQGLESIFLKTREIYGAFGIAFYLSYIFFFVVVMDGGVG